MRTLIAFGLCCGALAASLAWMARSAMLPVAREAPPATVATDVAGLSYVAEHPDESGSPKHTSDAAAQTGSQASSAGKPVASAALTAIATSEPQDRRTRGALIPAGTRHHDELARRLAKALDAIARDSHSVVALDDALGAAVTLGDDERVADLLGRKLQLAPDDQSLRFSYAAALMRLRRWVYALPELRTVAGARPDDQRVWHNLALTLHALGSLTDAREAWGTLLALAPSDLDARARRAELSLDLGDWRSAADDLAIVVATDSGATDALQNLALAKVKLGDFEGARAAIRPLLLVDGLKKKAETRLAEIDAAEREASVP